MIKRISLGIAMLTILCIPTQAQSYTDVVWTQIQNAYDNISDRGYSVKNYIIGTINEGSDNDWTFYLDSSKEYVFQGFCDEDCEDLDLYLYDSEGNEMDSDIEEDDYPVVYLDSERSGRYKVSVTMYSCSVEPCYFGLAVFQK
ncbi:MAG: hypothetical protein ED557_15670 [Balneola sp.]|nr:MAG: hypothetical protein ED557_15670 [Balneola sp.]